MFPPPLPSSPLLTVTNVCMHAEAISTGPGFFYINITDIPFNDYPPDVSTYIAAADALMTAAGSTNLYIYRAPYVPTDNYNSVVVNPAGQFVTIPIWIINKAASPVLAQAITVAQVSVDILTTRDCSHYPRTFMIHGPNHIFCLLPLLFLTHGFFTIHDHHPCRRPLSLSGRPASHTPRPECAFPARTALPQASPSTAGIAPTLNRLYCCAPRSPPRAVDPIRSHLPQAFTSTSGWHVFTSLCDARYHFR